MPSPLLATTLQSALLAGISNLIAQALTAYRNDGRMMQTELVVDWIPVIQFVLYQVINTPPNYLWQDFLESTFPARPSPAKSSSSSPQTSPSKPASPSQQPPLSIRNTILKLLLDQTIGSAFNTILFSTYIHSIRAATSHTISGPVSSPFKALSLWTSPGAVDFAAVDFAAVWAAARADFCGLIVAGWRFWPAVAVLNFSLVKTVQVRNLTGALAGIAWGVYVSLAAAQ